MPTSIKNKRSYTKAHAERIAALHTRLHGVSDVLVYGDIAHGNESGRVQILFVAEEEGLYQTFLRHLKEHRALYGSDMSEAESKFVVAQCLWNDMWPKWLDYKEHLADTDHLDITVVPFNWKDRLNELDELFCLKDEVLLTAYTVA